MTMRGPERTMSSAHVSLKEPDEEGTQKRIMAVPRLLRFRLRSALAKKLSGRRKSLHRKTRRPQQIVQPIANRYIVIYDIYESPCVIHRSISRFIRH